ncbi:hypothetical protein Q2T46_09800 [Thermoanaerobacterium sp. CMT5567-10]|uniref:Cas10/Cmr2 second palm domain-containing protein n=1 Tax=Thermoanaerobacterium sp. CMT5567-10 TaxID=3061989 RepID=UPI0026E0F46D|nr:hypothetical protein [Thermoanaerobacterium sp. CMT5567-10]WKV07856.1 hypothetical protein Q2T46_09800 [Thermoanaerobacterium sp. CMT5567-10]
MIFSLYDSTGIQNYIFSSNKLKEIVGGSELVRKMFKEFLIGAIKNCNFKYSDDDKDNMMDVDVRIVYIGGGNAALLYKDKNIMKKVNEEFSTILLKNATSIGYVTAYCEVDIDKDDFKEKRNELLNKLEQKKNMNFRGTRLLGLPITKPSANNEYPAIDSFTEDNREIYISTETKCKRDILIDNDQFNDFNYNGEKYEFPMELDELGQSEGENYIGVVHIDGNNMGHEIDKFLSEFDDFTEGMKAMRELSSEIDRVYKLFFEDMVKNLIINIKTEKLKFLELKNNTLPIRPVIMEGDDITFICNGKLALGLAVDILKSINKKNSVKIRNYEIPISACAGVAIVKSHFPIDRAYKIAEDCCGAAKRKGKFLKAESETVGNWLDFHIVNSGMTDELDEMRAKNYNLGSLKDPSLPPLSGDNNKLPQYNLLYRPWCIMDEGKYSWGNFEKIFESFKNWPRSKLMNLRDAFLEGREEVVDFMIEVRSKKLDVCKIDDVSYESLFDVYDMTPYYDVIEAFDYYIEI